jgi:hypothetical protein
VKASQCFSENLSFPFESCPQKLSENIMIDEVITIAPFEAPEQVQLVRPFPFRVIFGYGSLSLFDALGTDEVAGLKRKDAINFIEELKLKGKTEKDGAFIAGLTNIHNNKMFVFFNLTRLESSRGYAHRVLAHEPLHMARLMISTIANPNIDYVHDPYIELKDENEEYFAEMLERIAAITFNRFENIQKPSSLYLNK